ncbi:unnamed protein product [Musa acuminata subsp. burmannicoides]
MGGVEDNEPPSKRVKTSSLELENLSNTSSLSEFINPLGGLMARPLPSQGREDMVGSKGVIKKVEFVRIITKALYSLGYERSGAVLEEESGIPLHSSAVDIFRKQVLEGNWDESVIALQKIGLDDENILKSASFLILEQKFLELLGKNRVMEALDTLRSDITPLSINKKRVHELSCCVISPSQHMLLGFASLEIETSNARMRLLEELQKLLPPSIMIPERRLEHLVEQALRVQREACYFHNSHESCFSLYTDHQCGKDQLPSHTTQVLREHHDEVWFLQFSNQGKYLASSSIDRSAIIWEVREDGELTLKHKLSGHLKPVLMVAWSPDDSQLLTCGMEEVVRRWDVHSGECLHVYEKNGVGLISCGWFPDGKELFSGVTDRTICFWDLDGKELDSWKGQRTSKTSDVAVTKDGRHMISLCRETVILLLDRETKTERLIEEEQTITSFSLSKDDKFLLVNLINQEIHLWNIKDDPKLVTRYKGHKRSRFLIRSCFGGTEQAFIASGSEDSQVYIWHRSSGDLIQTLPGHSGTVNCVSWNPSNPHMLASASDDHTIRIWGLNRVNLKRKEIYSNGTARGDWSILGGRRESAAQPPPRPDGATALPSSPGTASALRSSPSPRTSFPSLASLCFFSAGIEFRFREVPVGGAALDSTGVPLPDETLAAAKESDAVLLGAIGGYKWDANEKHLKPETGLLQLRAGLGVFANLRPATVLPQLVDSSTLKKEVAEGVDIMVVRELTGGIYFGKPRGFGSNDRGEDIGFNTEVYSASEIDRIARVAFEVARKRHGKLCSVDKANVLEASMLWRKRVNGLASEFPDVELSHMYVDNAAMQLIRNPKQFDTIVTNNIFGDILSDEASMLTGSIGMLPSASIGDLGPGLFEPIHGSAPDIAGQDKANPLATVLSAAMLLRYGLGEEEAAKRIEAAVINTLNRGFRTGDIFSGGTTLVGCKQMGEEVLRSVEAGKQVAALH